MITVVSQQKLRGTYRAAIIAALFLLGASSAHAADLLLSPASGEFATGKTFSVKVMADSKGGSLSAAEATLTFDKSVLNVQSVSKNGSALALWPVEPTFSNAAGTIEFAGGNTSPFSGTKTLVTIVFKPIAEGTATVSFKSGLITEYGPTGKDVLEDMKGGEYTLAKGAAPTTPTTPTPPTQPTNPTLPAPLEPEIESDDHDPEKWYATTTFSFRWELPYGITSMKLLYDKEPESDPTVLYEPAIGDRTITLDGEGEWYLHAVFRNTGGWGIPAHRPIKVDLTPPSDLGLTADGGNLEAFLTFDVTDALSGIEKYEIVVDDRNPTTVMSSDVKNGKYTYEFASPGDYTLTVRALDYAGNFSTASTTVTVEGSLAPVIVEEEEPEEEGVPWGYILSIILAALTAYFYARLVYVRREYMDEKDHIKKEAGEAQEKLELIFNALRDEVEEQVYVLAKQPNLTDDERAVLQKLKDSLEISEELLDKEIEDVRKLLN